jgi:N-dimethylarginine dimethylaminohydrolase
LKEVPYPFEGEADFIESQEGFLFASGAILKQRFVPRLGFPPYKRLYGFRSDARNLSFLQEVVAGPKVIPLTLIDERFYHGDTLLFPFGSRKEFLLAYLDGLAPESRRTLSSLFGDRLIPLPREDALRFAANGFQVETKGTVHLILPVGLSDRLLQTIEKRGVKVLTADVTEFSQKGGGSVKCLLCDLGRM